MPSWSLLIGGTVLNQFQTRPKYRYETDPIPPVAVSWKNTKTDQIGKCSNMKGGEFTIGEWYLGNCLWLPAFHCFLCQRKRIIKVWWILTRSGWFAKIKSHLIFSIFFFWFLVPLDIMAFSLSSISMSLSLIRRRLGHAAISFWGQKVTTIAYLLSEVWLQYQSVIRK